MDSGGSIASLALVVTPMLAAFWVFLVFEIQHRLNSSGAGASPEDARRGVRNLLSAITLNLLLPMMVLEATFQFRDVPGSAAYHLAVVGGLLVFAPLAIAWVRNRSGLSTAGPRPAHALTFASFGGGNRGFFAILVLGPLLASYSGMEAESYKQAFAILDLGNLLALSICAPVLATTWGKKDNGIGVVLTEIIRVAPLPVLVALTVAAFALPQLQSLLLATKSVRHELLAFVSTLYVLFSLPRRNQFSRVWLALGWMLALRVLLAVAAVATYLLWAQEPVSTGPALISPPVIAIMLLCAAPPSSIVPSLLGAHAFDDRDCVEATGVTAVWTLGFVALVAFIALFLALV